MHNQTKNDTNFKSYKLPLARIKKIMKADKDVKVLDGFGGKWMWIEMTNGDGMGGR